MARRPLHRKIVNVTGEHYLGWGFWQVLKALWRLLTGS